MLSKFLKRPRSCSTPAPPEDPVVTHPAVVGDDAFAATVRASPSLAIVDFWAEWCQPCDTMAEWVERLAADYPEQIRVLALDVDENPRTPARYGVMGLPTLIAFRDGAEIWRTTGVSTYGSLKRDIEKLLVNRKSEVGNRTARTPMDD